MHTSNSQVIQYTLKDSIYIVVGTFFFGASQAILVYFALFSGPNLEIAKAYAERDAAVVREVLEKCEVFSAVSSSYRLDGTLVVECTVDLKYFKQLADMKRYLQKKKREKELRKLKKST